MPKSKSKRTKRQPPPKPKPKKSPPWVGATFFTLLLAGATVIITNYMAVFEGGTVNSRLWYGLGLISLSFVVATRWH
ncbi:MAG: cell division protein CrgA [Actinomycetota bacterium]|nr:cell division protein CrgA [Actinomycetota bacterium]